MSVREAQVADATGGGMRLLPSGDIRVQHMTLTTIIGIAHQIDSYRVVNQPDWTNATYFDIIARADAQPTRDETFTVMQSTMLADRFKLAAHRDTRSLQGFDLVRAS